MTSFEFIPYDDHGAFSGDAVKAQTFLYNNNLICFIIVIIAIITAEFWFEVFHQILREITGQEEPRWYYMLISALFWTVVFIVINYLTFKLPVAASYGL